MMSDDEDAKWNADMDRLLNEVESPQKHADGGKWKEKRITSAQTSKTDRREEPEGRVGLMTRKGVGRGATDRLFGSMFRNPTETDTGTGHPRVTPDRPYQQRPTPAPRSAEADEDWLGLDKNTTEPTQPSVQTSRAPFGRRTRLEDNIGHESSRARIESQSLAPGMKTEGRLGRPEGKGLSVEPSQVGLDRTTFSSDISVGRELNRPWPKGNEKETSFDIGALLAQKLPSRPEIQKDPATRSHDHDPPLPFLLPPSKDSLTTSAPPPQEDDATQVQVAAEPPPIGVGGKKKVVVVRKQGTDGVGAKTTLQLPAHLVDEEDLKMMSGSLKALYAHQLSMLEGAYKDQMECQAQSAARREEMLKDELSTLRQDFEGRVERLKKELWEMETKCRSQESATLMAIDDQLRELGNKMAALILTQSQQSTKLSTIEQSAERGSQDSVRSLTESMSQFRQSLESGLKTSLAETILSASSRKDSSEQNKEATRLEKLVIQLDTLLRDHYQNSKAVERELAKSGRRLESEAKKLCLQEKKLRGTLQKGTSEALDQSVKAIKLNYEKRKLDRGMTKKFQKEVREALSELKSTFAGMQVKDGSLENGQLHQLMKDLNTSLQAQRVMQSGDGVRETEMERDQLVRERKWLSEQKTELSDIRAQMERGRAEIESRKSLLKEEVQELQRFHTSTQIKLEHAHQIRKEAEASQLEHSHLAAQFKVKLEEMEQERSVQKAFLESREEGIRIKEQNVAREQAEIRREKAFLDKVRSQSLCVECQKLLPPLPLKPQERSAGDGLDVAIQSSFQDMEPLQNMVHRYYVPQMFRIDDQPHQRPESWS